MRHRMLAGASLCLLVLLAYSNSFDAGFVLDNRVLILEDARVHRATIDNLSNILNRSYWWPVVESGLYRPVTTFSYLFNYAILGNGDRPAGYHWINLLLHAANVLLVFALGVRFSRNVGLAWLIAAVWAVHPLGTEAVTNIIGRADLLAGLGVLGALFAHVKARETAGRERLLWWSVVTIALTMGVFSKESAVAVVGVAVLYDIAVSGRRIPTSALLAGWLVFLPPLVLMWYQRAAVLGNAIAARVSFVDNPIVGAGFWQARLTALSVTGRYLRLIVWPNGLSPDYSFSQIPLASGGLHDWIAWVVVAAAAAVAILLWRVHRLTAFAMIGAFVMFLPVSNLVFATGTIMAERLMYVPSVGLVAALVIAAYSAARRFNAPAVAPLVLAAVVLALGVRTWMRNADWQSELSLWSSAATIAPDSFKTHGALAEALYNADPTRANLPLVITEKERSLAILAAVPDPAAVSLPHREAATYYLELGDSLQAQGRAPTEVGAAYRKAADAANRFLALADTLKGASPRDIGAAQLIVSTARARLNDNAGAIAAGLNAIALEPFNPRAYQITAAAFVSADRHDEAAIALMTGFIVTGNAELRAFLIRLYESGVDREHCAVSSTPKGIVLNSSCDVVARHLCAAAAEAMAIHRRQGRPDLADQIQATTVQGLRCSSGPAMRMNR